MDMKIDYSKWIYISIIFILILNSCSSYSDKVEKALCLAAGNRGQLEQVLLHYQKCDADSLKFKAACYLNVIHIYYICKM